jgi:hypothetical protein
VARDDGVPLDSGSHITLEAEGVDSSNVTSQPSPMQAHAHGKRPLEAAGPSSISIGPAPAAQPVFIYALGRIQPRFPSLALEKEYAQASGRAETAGLTDQETARTVLRANRYLARQLCWVFTVEGLETYILVPRDPADLDLLLDTMRAAPRTTDVDVVIGTRGPIAPPEACNGLMVPIVIIDQLYSFDVDALIRAIPRPETPADKFEATAEELFTRIAQMADNAGATDEHRALNYLAVRYPVIYARTSDMHVRNYSLTGVEVRPSRLSGVRTIVDVIFSFSNRQTAVIEQFFTRVDVTEEFPFLVTAMSPYYEKS